MSNNKKIVEYTLGFNDCLRIEAKSKLPLDRIPSMITIKYENIDKIYNNTIKGEEVVYKLHDQNNSCSKDNSEQETAYIYEWVYILDKTNDNSSV